MQVNKEFGTVEEARQFLAGFDGQGLVSLYVFDTKCEECDGELVQSITTFICSKCGQQLLKSKQLADVNFSCPECKIKLDPLAWNWYCKECEVTYDRHKIRWV